MKIAFFVSPLDTIPVSSEHILAPWYLAETIVPKLVARGHQVTTYCAEGSHVPGAMVTAGVTPCVSQIDTMEPREFASRNARGELQLASRLFQDAQGGRFDVIHVFQGAQHVLPFVPFVTTPVLCTFHDPFTQSMSALSLAYGQQKNLFFTALSLSHSKGVSGGMPPPYVVYNGMPIQEYPFSPLPGTYVMTCGRIVPQKGHDDAIAAVGTDENLVIAGKYYKNDPNMYAYWLVKILPAIDGKRIRYIPFTRNDSYRKLLAGAKALLFPIRWDEPFGLVMVEAMACGTPVIAYNRGSVSEIVKDGVTGFIIDPDLPDLPNHPDFVIKKTGIEGLAEAIHRIGEIDRAACRRHVEEHFTVDRMVDGYIEVYKKILQR